MSVTLEALPNEDQTPQSIECTEADNVWNLFDGQDNGARCTTSQESSQEWYTAKNNTGHFVVQHNSMILSFECYSCVQVRCIDVPRFKT